MKLFVQPSVYVPDPENCGNKWCQGHGNVPASGDFPEMAACSSYETLRNNQMATGGVTGRGVTPCPFGFLNRIPQDSENGSIQLLIPFHGKGFDNLAGRSIYFDPDRPTYLPPTGNVRPLARIGNEWKN